MSAMAARRRSRRVPPPPNPWPALRRQPGWVVRESRADAPPKDFPVPAGTDAGAHYTMLEYRFGVWLLTHPDAAPARLELRDPSGRVARLAAFPALDDAWWDAHPDARPPGLDPAFRPPPEPDAPGGCRNVRPRPRRARVSP